MCQISTQSNLNLHDYSLISYWFMQYFETWARKNFRHFFSTTWVQGIKLKLKQISSWLSKSYKTENNKGSRSFFRSFDFKIIDEPLLCSCKQARNKTQTRAVFRQKIDPNALNNWWMILLFFLHDFSFLHAKQKRILQIINHKFSPSFFFFSYIVM